MQHIRDVKDKLKVGQWIRTNADGLTIFPEMFEGTIISIGNKKVHINVPSRFIRWYIDSDNSIAEIEILREPEEFRVGDKVKVFKKSTADCSAKVNGYDCCKKYIEKIGTVRYVGKDEVTVKNFPGFPNHCDAFSFDCLSLVERGDKNEATEEQPKQVIKLNQKGEVRMKKVISDVFKKTDEALLVEKHLRDIFPENFIYGLIVRDYAKEILGEAKRLEREEREKV